MLDGCWTGAGRVLAAAAPLTEHQVEEVLPQEHLVYRSEEGDEKEEPAAHEADDAALLRVLDKGPP